MFCKVQNYLTETGYGFVQVKSVADVTGCVCVVSGSLALAHGGVCTVFNLGFASKTLKQSLIQSRCISRFYDRMTSSFMAPVLR